MPRIKHFYRIYLKDGIEVNVSKSDFDHIIRIRAECQYRTMCVTHKIDDATDVMECIHIIDEK